MIVNQALARSLLEHAKQFSWTVQGFGMVRTYLDDRQRWRLNLWDDRLQTPGVSLVHTHPWSFTSYVIGGRIVNQCYTIEDGAHTHFVKEIVTGEAGGDVGAPQSCRLVPRKPEIITPGNHYSQHLTEVHETRAQRGTVTLNDRTPPTKSYTARVFWNIAERDWMAARPRPATWDEVEGAVQAALRLL